MSNLNLANVHTNTCEDLSVHLLKSSGNSCNRENVGSKYKWFTSSVITLNSMDEDDVNTYQPPKAQKPE